MEPLPHVANCNYRYVTLAVYTAAPPHSQASSQQLQGGCGGNLQAAGPRFTYLFRNRLCLRCVYPSHRSHFRLSIFLRLRCRDPTWQIVWVGCRIQLRHRCFRWSADLCYLMSAPTSRLLRCLAMQHHHFSYLTQDVNVKCTA